MVRPAALMDRGSGGGGALARANTETVLIIACGALAREILALKEANGLTHVSLKCLPAELHNRPQLIPAAVQEAIQKAKPHYSSIVVAYADCGTGGALDRVLEEEGVSRIEGPHCYAFFSGIEAFEDRGDTDFESFFLTDFLARHFESLVIKPLGLDRHPQLRDAYFQHYKRLVYLAQTDDAVLHKKAVAAAERLGLQFETRRTGYGDLGGFVKTL